MLLESAFCRAGSNNSNNKFHEDFVAVDRACFLQSTTFGALDLTVKIDYKQFNKS